MSAAESARAAQTGAVAGLCPSTEANLGDGIFDTHTWLESGGHWGLGSDSHANVNAAEEMMLLEYSQRLATRQRNVMATQEQTSVATAMTLAAVNGGAQACGREVAGLVVGQQADAIVLDAQHTLLRDLPSPEAMLSTHVFASHRQSAISQVWIAGELQVQSGRHVLHDSAMSGLISARNQLLENTQ
jgi:formimidoylglutamate deiminase